MCQLVHIKQLGYWQTEFTR